MNNLDDAMNKVLEYIWEYYDGEVTENSLFMARVQFECDYDMKDITRNEMVLVYEILLILEDDVNIME